MNEQINRSNKRKFRTRNGAREQRTRRKLPPLCASLCGSSDRFGQCLHSNYTRNRSRNRFHVGRVAFFGMNLRLTEQKILKSLIRTPWLPWRSSSLPPWSPYWPFLYRRIYGRYAPNLIYRIFILVRHHFIHNGVCQGQETLARPSRRGACLLWRSSNHRTWQTLFLPCFWDDIYPIYRLHGCRVRSLTGS